MKKAEAIALLEGLIEAIDDGVSMNYDNRNSLGYRFTFKKGSKKGEEQLAALRKMISQENKSVRSGRQYWPEHLGKYPRQELRVCVKGRCGKGNWNNETMRFGFIPAKEASRFDVYVLNKY